MEKFTLKDCKGKDHLVPLEVTALRMVEAQYHISTRKLVDSLEEQSILEDLIESNKPAFPQDSSGLHYLLSRPFRYPPLMNGSRFGTRFEPSFWYGSLQLDTLMAETAFYRFHFLRASEAQFGEVVTSHTVFAAKIKTARGLDLTQPPFSSWASLISSPISYRDSQELGKALRQDQVEVICYQSARDPKKGSNIALATPKAFAQKSPVSNSFQSWQCITNKKVADFMRLSSIFNETRSYSIDIFKVNSQLPFPAY